MSLQNPKFPSKLKSAEMADETELFYTSVSKVVVFAGLLVSVNDLHKGAEFVCIPCEANNSKSVIRNGVWVRVPLPAPDIKNNQHIKKHLLLDNPLASAF